ncbi:uncharacterized protein LOC133203932 isoform X2 [Saccostrea echinata]|uniref:uncharacterized protein LOC133203932 isoform X2 n=1 Tax=Saccostrea echinata TaxID=191078 RepID=UPI002A81F0E3|nr:uncharacterized protein LOC133203932 isoform X2 [Saccostrea echinata]
MEESNLTGNTKFSEEKMSKVSEIISNSMFFTMTCSSKTEAQMCSILLLEFLYFSRYKKTVQRYFGGSAAEGTNIKTSDIDKMIVGPNIYVCSDPAEGQMVRGHVFLVDSSDCSQGHAKLVLLKTDETIPTIFDEHGKTLNDMLEERQDGKRLLSNEKVVSFWMNFLQKRETATGPPGTSRHGPCATAKNTDPQGYIKSKIGGVIEQDFAHGIPFCSHPPVGKDWLKDRENFKWPSKKVVEKIKSLTCHIVAVGDKMSEHSDVEWRISYLLWERELVWSFNDIQLQCYVLLKVLLKKYIDPVAPEELSSYHMKTIVFWESENIIDNFWHPKYLIQFARNCLLCLKGCILNCTLKHFIDRGKNLFLWRLRDPKVKDAMLNVIEEIIQNIIRYSMQCVEGIDLNTTLENSDGNVEEFLRKCRLDHDPRITYDFNESREPLRLFHYGEASSLNVNVETVLADFSTLARYKESFEENDRYIKDVHASIKIPVKKFIHIRSAMILAKQMLLSKSFSSEEFQKLTNFMDENSDLDAVSGKLYVATCFVAFKKYDKGAEVMKKIYAASKKSDTLIYAGLCSDCKSMCVSGGTLIQDRGLPRCSLPQTKYLSIFHDVIFAQGDLPLLPDALKFECFVDKVFLVHPSVYLLYLKILCSKFTEKRDNISQLENAVYECDVTLHTYRHFNILGYCYFENGDYEEAFKCYRISFSRTVDNGRPNAVIYMLPILVYSILQNQRFDSDSEIIYQR